MTAAGESASVRDAVRGVLELAKDGRVDEAEARCRAELARRPDDVNLTALLGAVLLRKGDYAESETHLRRAIAREPAFAKAQEDLGMLYLASGRPGAAIERFEAAVALDPRQPSAFYALATALERSGRLAEAGVARERFLALSPDGRALAEAARLRRAGDTGRAEKICGEILAREPRNVHAMRLVARIAADRQRDAAAEGLWRRLISIEPDFFPAYRDLAQFLGERGRFPEAVAMLEKAAALRPDDAGLLQILGDTLAVVGRSADALQAYENVLALQPDDPHAHLGRAHMLRIHGRRAESIAAYRRCTQIRPELGDAWWNLSTFRGFEFTNDERQTMRKQLAAATADSASAIALQFATARACEGEANFEEAWSHYETANAAKRRNVTYDPVETETQHDARLRVFDEAFMQRATAMRADRAARPVFVTGMPRSGSTLIEQILASHSAVEGCGELPYAIMLAAGCSKGDGPGEHYPEVVTDLSTEDWRALGDEYLGRVAAHRSESTPWFTDKMPANFAHLGFIRTMLPEAVFIDARRNPLDTCVANYRQLFAQGKDQSYDLMELGEYTLQYLRVMRHWQAVIPGRILTVNYEDVVADLEAQVRRLLAHCGLPFEERCLRFFDNRRHVNTASSEQVREPIYGDAVGYWRHYEGKLDELREILAPALPRE